MSARRSLLRFFERCDVGFDGDVATVRFYEEALHVHPTHSTGNPRFLADVAALTA
ncbi:hypothetical protein AB0F77_27525 [Streptomyces sp. NPDC026672]|uniref:hypothetical protein n=1 Tax=unclassified Streptomyces TaxID=2593676 RepID=UPI0033FE1F84